MNEAEAADNRLAVLLYLEGKSIRCFDKNYSCIKTTFGERCPLSLLLRMVILRYTWIKRTR